MDRKEAGPPEHEERVETYRMMVPTITKDQADYVRGVREWLRKGLPKDRMLEWSNEPIPPYRAT